MATEAGTWRLDEAIAAHWESRGLDTDFRAEWLDPTAMEYEPLHDGMARPEPPGPYCVYEKDEPEILARMTGIDNSGDDRELQRWTFRFKVHAQDTSSESAKSIAQRLAKKIAAAFDPHNAIQFDGVAHVVTERGPDWHDQEGEQEASWTLQFSILVDATVGAFGGEAEFSSSSSFSETSTTSMSSSSSCSSVTEPIAEEDDVLDFGDIGGVYDSQAAAVANRAALIAYLATRVNEPVELGFRGPVDYLDSKRQPANVYLDLSAGAIAITVGGAGNMSHLTFFGGSKIFGVNAATPATPIFQITRGSGQMPRVVIRGLAFESDGSVIKFVYGGSGVVLEDVKIDDFTGAGSIDHEDWTDVEAETCSYGVWLEDADGARIQNLQIKQGSGHGIVATRLHAGDVDARIQLCEGAGFKLQQFNGNRAHLWAESCNGYGLLARDCGGDRRSGGVKVANDGAPNDWRAWFEANNGRGTSHGASGYRFSQFKLANCTRIKMAGHSGWRDNQARLDRISRLRNEFVEDYYLDPSVDPDLYLVGAAGAGDEYLVNVANITLPPAGFGNASCTNWDTVWTDPGDRPTATIVGSGTASDPERIRITWPGGCFDATSGTDTAYWRPFWAVALSSPGSYFFTAQIKATTSVAGTYCASRESLSVANRQTNSLGSFSIAPVSGAITGLTLWDTHSRWLSGSFTVDDIRSDISPQFAAWDNGMQDLDGDASQDTEIIVDIYQLRLYKFV